MGYPLKWMVFLKENPMKNRWVGGTPMKQETSINWHSQTRNLVISRYFVNESCGVVEFWVIRFMFRKNCSLSACWSSVCPLLFIVSAIFHELSGTKNHPATQQPSSGNSHGIPALPVMVNRAKNAKLVYSMGVFPGCADHPKMAKQHSPCRLSAENTTEKKWRDKTVTLW